MSLDLRECHSKDCKVRVHPSLFMCIRHWRMVPQRLKHYLKEAYRPGQEVDKRPSAEWTKAAAAIIAHVAQMEAK